MDGYIFVVFPQELTQNKDKRTHSPLSLTSQQKTVKKTLQCVINFTDSDFP